MLVLCIFEKQNNPCAGVMIDVESDKQIRNGFNRAIRAKVEWLERQLGISKLGEKRLISHYDICMIQDEIRYHKNAVLKAYLPQTGEPHFGE